MNYLCKNPNQFAATQRVLLGKGMLNWRNGSKTIKLTSSYPKVIVALIEEPGRSFTYFNRPSAAVIREAREITNYLLENALKL